MEWVDGARLNDRASIAAMGLDSSKFVDTLVQCSLKQMLENGFFHADPHAGNLLAMPSGNNHSMLCIYVCHFNCVSTLLHVPQIPVYILIAFLTTTSTHHTHGTSPITCF